MQTNHIIGVICKNTSSLSLSLLLASGVASAKGDDFTKGQNLDSKIIESKDSKVIESKDSTLTLSLATQNPTASSLKDIAIKASDVANAASLDSIESTNIESKTIESNNTDSITLADSTTTKSSKTDFITLADSTTTKSSKLDSITLADSTPTESKPAQDAQETQDTQATQEATTTQEAQEKQDNTSAKSYRLQSVVTTATGFTQDIRDAPASMSVITNKDLQGRPIRDLSDAVSQIPGVSVDIGATSFGGFAVSIRGMPTSYTLFLVDGARQDANSEAFPNVSFSQSSFMPPISAIDRIEVIRGPASTIYGSDAIGGVVNVILKKSFDKWVGNATLESTIQERRIFSDSIALSLFGAGPIDKAKKWSLQLRVRDVYSFAPSQKLTNPSSGVAYTPNNISLIGAGRNNQANAGARIGYQMNEKNYFYLDNSYFNSWYDPEVFENSYFTRNNTILRHQGSYGDKGLVRTDTFLQYNSNYNESRNRLGQDAIFEHRTIFPFWRMKIIGGGQYVYNSVAALNGTQFGGDYPSMIDRHNFSLYLEDEWMILDSLIFTLGGRANMNNAFGFNFSPRGFLVYHILDGSAIGDLTLKGGVSQGYKVPTITQVTPGWGSSTCRGACRVFGNPDLKPESSLNYELTLMHESDYSNVSVTGFYTSFNDKITSFSGLTAGTALPGGFTCPSFTGGTSNGTGTCQYSINVDKAQSYGIEVAAELKPLNLWGFGEIGSTLSYTWNKNEQLSGAGKGLPLAGVPEHTLNFALNYSYNDIFGVFFRGEFRAKQTRLNVLGRSATQSALDTFLRNNPNVSMYYDPYFVAHIGGNVNIMKTLRLNLGIYNLFDHNFVDLFGVTNRGSTTYYNNYSMIQEGRRYYLSLSYDF